jgi:hypothetical protein
MGSRRRAGWVEQKAVQIKDKIYFTKRDSIMSTQETVLSLKTAYQDFARLILS